MTVTFALPDAVDRLKRVRGILAPASWGDGTEAVCLMSALVPGAQSEGDCVTAGWPAWLVFLNVRLFDADVGGDEEAARWAWSLDVARAVSTPRDMDAARDRFLILRLADGEHSALAPLRSLPGQWGEQVGAVEAVVALLRRRLAGEDVTVEMEAAEAAAWAASRRDLVAALNASSATPSE